MYICLECGHVFEEPRHFSERHNLDTPPYEQIIGCPCCAGAFAKAIQCDICGKYIEGEYVKTVYEDIYCSDCYTVKDIAD